MPDEDTSGWETTDNPEFIMDPPVSAGSIPKVIDGRRLFINSSDATGQTPPALNSRQMETNCREL
jgi:hypothetical protein